MNKIQKIKKKEEAIDRINELIDRVNQLSELLTKSGENVSKVSDQASYKRRCYLSWIEAYGDQGWVDQEIRKAKAWIEANPRKRPKRFERFMTNWLSRSWEQYRKTIPSNRVSVGLSQEDL